MKKSELIRQNQELRANMTEIAPELSLTSLARTNTMRKGELRKQNQQLRENVASILMSESLGKSDVRYQDILIKGEYNDFFDEYSRKETMLDDSLANRLTLGYMIHILQKRPKFTKDDEVQTEYIMPATRAAIKTLNLTPKFIDVGMNCIFNGWSLVKWIPQMGMDKVTEERKMTGLSCRIFGFEECHPRNWFRFRKPEKVNLIRYYRAIYIPRPHGKEASTYTSLQQERFLLKPNDPTFQHLTRIDRNYGLGYSRIQPIWDSITKLRERSDSEHFMKTNFMEARYPSSWTASGKAKKFIEKVRKVTRRKGIAIEAVVDPRTNQDTGLPSVQHRPWGQGTQGQEMDTNAASAYLDGEWLRLIANLGYSQLWATGGNAGALEGSEINLTQDDRADIAEFSVLAPIFKEILKRLAELGIMEAVGVPPEEISLLLSKDYEMLSWLTWEFNDKAALQQEQLEHEMEMSRGDSDNRNQYDKSNAAVVRYNTAVQNTLIHAVLNFDSMPETPVMSSWIKSIAYEPGSLYMTVHDQTKRGITTYEYNPPDEAAMYQDWVDSDSKGGFWWDWIEGVYSPAFKHGQMPAYLKTGFGEDVFGTSEETREFKMEGSEEEGIIGAGTTREPFRIDPSTYISTPKPAYTSTPSEPASDAPARRDTPREAPRAPYTTPYSPTYNKKFKSILNSASALRRFAKGISTKNNPTGWSMKQVTPYKISELVNEVIKESFRTNRVSFGNSIKAGHPYNYGGDDEYICPRDYKKNIGKIVPLGIYHNRDNQGNVDLPEWQVIGTHEVLGWDDTLGQEIAKNDYDIDKIATFFNKINEVNWIQPYLDNGQEPPISGAYSCNITKYNNKNYQVNIDLKSMSFVPDANCPWDVCNFKPEEEMVS